MEVHVKDVAQFLETIAPPTLQENYDNSGLLVGEPSTPVEGIVCSLDMTEEVIEEAAVRGCNLVVAHHPIIFKGLKRLTGKTYVERAVMLALRKRIALYAIHTNLDNVYRHGVNAKIAEKIGLENTRLLAPKTGLQQISLQVKRTEQLAIQDALKPVPDIRQHWMSAADPGYVQIDIQCAREKQGEILELLTPWQNDHPARMQPMTGHHPSAGSGLIGKLPEPMAEAAFIDHVKKRLQAAVVRHTKLLGNTVRRVAVCGGAGGFLLGQAIASGADVFITADYKYHEFFDADGQLVIADVGHYESEQYTIELLNELLSEKFFNFAVHSTQVRTNPVFYR